ncbi:MAG TPA: PfkB family carbohydrate kinase [Rhizomicrobium sp.]|jgi:rfaE bifunctional protein kinase chain/domain|nr:PfkB family carbohydrate kinase [Rhizomicrobium sp.]
MRRATIEDAIRSMSSRRVAVLGDIMLDIWEYGGISRLSPEAPVPVVQMQSRIAMLGGAANAARNARSCGAAVTLFGVIGADRSADEVRGLLAESGIEGSGVFVDAGRPTTQKRRIVGPDGHLLRVDHESTSVIPGDLTRKISAALASAMAGTDALVISDYAKGVMTAELAEQAIALARQAGIPMVVDTKPAHASFYKRPTVVTPNAQEALEMTASSSLAVAGNRLVEVFGAPAIVTSGADGMSLFGDGEPLHIPALDVAVADVSGAGDTVTMGVALGLSAGLGLADAMRLANLMAGHVVAKKGTAAVTAQELLQARW